MCDRSKEIVKSCDFHGMLKAETKVFRAICKSGIASIKAYPVETCIINARDCDEVAACYGDKSDDEEKDDEDVPEVLAPGALSVPSHNKRSLMKRSDSEVWRTLFWVSLIVLGFFSFGMLALLLIVNDIKRPLF
jgi:hypothetical protein